MNTYYTDITTQRIQIEGIFYTHWEIAMIRMNIPTDKQSFRQELFTFLSEWFNRSCPYFRFDRQAQTNACRKRKHDGKRLPHLFISRTERK